MPLVFKQCVKIHNVRLQLLSVFLQLVAAAAVVGQFVHYQKYYRKTPVDGEAKLTVDNHPNESELALISQQMQKHSCCMNSRTFDYWHSLDRSSYKYDGHLCAEVCSGEPRSGKCFDANSIASMESDQNVFFASQVQQMVNDTFRNYFLPSVEAMSIEVAFQYEVRIVPWYSSYEKPLHWLSSYSDIETRVLSRDGATSYRIEPGQPIRFSVAQLMQLSGESSLDTVQPLAGKNFKPGVPQPGSNGPAYRVSGIELVIVMNCGRDAENKYGFIRQHIGICVLQVESRPGKWAVKDMDSGATARGVRVRGVVKGREFSIDINSIFINVTSSAVFLAVPNLIIYVIALWCCGHISQIYRRLVYRNFSIAAEAGAMAMRLLEHEVAFNDLEEYQDGFPSNHISPETIRNRLGHVLESRRLVLDSTELSTMIEFCLETVNDAYQQSETHVDDRAIASFLNEAFEGLNHIISDAKEALGIEETHPSQGEIKIDVDRFAGACSSADPISFSSMIKLFDKDRRMHFMEAFFMPQRLRNALSQARRKIGRQGRTSVASMHHGNQITHQLTQTTAKVQELEHLVTQGHSDKQEARDYLAEKMNDIEGRVARMEHIMHDQRERQQKQTQQASSQAIMPTSSLEHKLDPDASWCEPDVPLHTELASKENELMRTCLKKDDNCKWQQKVSMLEMSIQELTKKVMNLDSCLEIQCTTHLQEMSQLREKLLLHNVGEPLLRNTADVCSSGNPHCPHPHIIGDEWRYKALVSDLELKIRALHQNLTEQIETAQVKVGLKIDMQGNALRSEMMQQLRHLHGMMLQQQQRHQRDRVVSHVSV